MLGLLENRAQSMRRSKHRPPPQGWNVVNKDLLLPALIVGSFTKASHGRASLLGNSFGDPDGTTGTCTQVPATWGRLTPGACLWGLSNLRELPCTPAQSASHQKRQV